MQDEQTESVLAERSGDSSACVLLKSCQLAKEMPFPACLAQHLWFDLFDGERWFRLEIYDAESGATLAEIEAERACEDIRWERKVILYRALYGEAAQHIVDDIRETWASYPRRDGRFYRAWPGPNSNTFARWVMDRYPELAAPLHHNTIGRSYTPLLSLRRTPSRTGFALDTLVGGVSLGLREGIEAHVLGLTCGVALYPPSIKLPFLPAIGLRAKALGTSKRRSSGEEREDG